MLNRSQRTPRDIGDEIKEQFLPRPDKYKDLINSKVIPITNESIVVIPCLTKTYGFKTNQYKLNDKYLNGVISEKNFNSFIRKANNIIEKQLINKSELENQPFFKFTSILLKISIILSALALFIIGLITYFDFQKDTSNTILYVSVVLLGSSSLVAALCPIVLYRSKYTALNFQQIISSKLKALQAHQNKQNDADGIRHINWKIHNKFYWMELHINRFVMPAPPQSSLPTTAPEETS